MKDFVPHKQAVQLKELGFDEPCFALYCRDNESYLTHCNSHEQYHGQVCMRPTYSQAFRWFREKKLSDMCVCRYQDRTDGGVYYYYSITHDYGIEETRHSKEGFFSYEEAELACLVKLIELVKNKQNGTNSYVTAISV